MQTNRSILFASLGAILLPTAPAAAQYRLDFGPRDAAYQLVGPGVQTLDPVLRRTPRGRAFVMKNFDFNTDGRLEVREAVAANEGFGQLSREERDRIAGRGQGEEAYDPAAMRAYGFRQTPRGATMSLGEDVLFRTASADLRPGAVGKLDTLAGYLRANPRVRVAIDGYTDSRGGAAYNQRLSERRAANVAAGLVQLGASRARFSTVGHGERNPVATNATAAGQQRNRRVEITLLGQRADRLAR